MDRARRAAGAALFLFCLLASVAFGVGSGGETQQPAQVAAVPTWSVSTLVLSEVMTGGSSASDEFVEVHNAGGTPIDLAGLEIVYVTSTGSTVTRKAAWPTSVELAPGAHALVANGAGIFALAADATYSGGFAATGGALVLRPIGGAPLDAVGWGDATNAFVEGAAVAAPPAGSSVERRPGGSAGSGTDTNDNAADWLLQATPGPQNLASAPTPGSTPAPTPGPSGIPTLAPSGSPTPVPSGSPTSPSSPSTAPTPTPTPTIVPSPTPEPSGTPTVTPSPSPAPTATPSPTPPPTPSSTPMPTPTPTPPPTGTPTPEPSATPSPSSEAPTDIATARALPDGTIVRIAGTLTTPLGALEAGHGAFVEDTTGGIALYLADAVVGVWPAGTRIEVAGELDARFAQRTLRIEESGITAAGAGALPGPLDATTGGAGEALEGRRLRLAGVTIGSPSSLADGTAVTIDDGTGAVRVVISPLALGGASLPSGTSIVATGPLGQRDSTGTGAAGYRLHVTEAGDLQVQSPSPSPEPTPPPGPSPTPTTSPAPTPSPRPTVSPAPTPAPSASSSPSPASVTSIADARSRPAGTRVTVEGVVTAEPGRLGSPPLMAIQDATAGVVVKLPDGFGPVARGTRVRITGPLADPYGQVELRPAASGIERLGTGAVLSPVEVEGALDENAEGRLVAVAGTLQGTVRRATSGDISLDVETADGTSVRLMADASSGLTKDSFVAGGDYRFTGIAGQRASRKGALDGYRIWLRDTSDRQLLAAPQASPAAGGGEPSPSAGAAPALLPIAQALLRRDGAVTVSGTVTAENTLLDSSGRRIVIEDASAAVEVLLPSGSASPPVGSSVRVSGTMGRAYGAPRLRATDVAALGAGSSRAPLSLRGAPGTAHEWRLVRISGTVVEVRKLGSRWRAELQVGSVRVPIDGLAGAGIPPAALVEGRLATVTGIVRRPHPSAADRRFGVVPRGPADLSIGPADGTAPASGGDQPRGGNAPGAPDPGRPVGPIDVDLVDLAAHLGETVRVGGLIVDLAPDGVTVDDGTAVATVVLLDAAADYLPLLEPGDAINATGRIEQRGDDFAVVVRDPAGLARVGDLGDLGALVPSDPPPSIAASPEPQVAFANAEGLGVGLGPETTFGLATIVALSAASTAVTLLRRRAVRQRLLARVATRLATIAPAVEPAAVAGPPQAGTATHRLESRERPPAGP